MANMTELKYSKGSFLQRAIDSSAVKLFGVVATVIGLVFTIGPLLHRHAAGTVPQPALAVVMPASRPDVRESPLPVRRSSRQSAFGAQSPNVSDVQHDIKIGYQSNADGVTHASPKKESAIPSKAPGTARSTEQTSFGDQSPNISGVGGSVEIEYNSVSTSTQKSAPEGGR